MMRKLLRRNVEESRENLPLSHQPPYQIFPKKDIHLVKELVLEDGVVAEDNKPAISDLSHNCDPEGLDCISRGKLLVSVKVHPGGRACFSNNRCIVAGVHKGPAAVKVELFQTSV